MAKKNQGDTYSYKGWLISDNFWKRAFAVFGYSLVAPVIIYGAILLLVIVAMIIGVLIGIAQV